MYSDKDITLTEHETSSSDDSTHDSLFIYDKVYFSSLDKASKYLFIKELINNLANSLHNPELIENSEFVYHLLSDGCITCRKGGKSYDYGKDSTVIRYECIRPSTFFTFDGIATSKPVGFTYEHSYVILSREDCIAIRDLMDELLLRC